MMDQHSLHAFHEHLLKSAAMPAALLRSAGRFVTDSTSRGALVGAGVGALGGVATRQEGESALQAGLRGGAQGAAVGAVGGGLGRAYRDTHLLARDAGKTLSTGQAVGETVRRVGRGVANFGKRQLHGFTGAYGDQAAEIGMRSSGNSARVRRLEELRHADRLQGMAPQKAKQLTEKHVGRMQGLTEEGLRGDDALRAGITNVPGVVRGLATRPGETAKALKNEMLAGGGMGAGAVAVGLPLALAAPDLARGDESATGGRTMRQKLVNTGSGLVGGALTAGMPIIPQIATGIGIDSLAARTIARGRPNAQQVPA